MTIAASQLGSFAARAFLRRPHARGAKGRTDAPRIVDWYMDGKIDIDSLITHTMPVEKINDAFNLMHAGKSIRSVVR